MAQRRLTQGPGNHLSEIQSSKNDGLPWEGRSLALSCKIYLMPLGEENLFSFEHRSSSDQDDFRMNCV